MKPGTKKQVQKKTASQDNNARNELGFLHDSDLARAWGVIRAGGSSRLDVHHKLVALFDGELTSTGKSKPVSTIMNQVLARATAMGYSVKEGGWTMVPPTEEVDWRSVVQKRPPSPKKKSSKPAEKATKKTSKKMRSMKPLKPSFKGLKKKSK